jgi:DNA modification methylase
MENKDYLVFDPFMGSGTTGVVGREVGINVVGNEVNPFLYEICKVKTSPHKISDSEPLMMAGEKTLKVAREKWRSVDIREENSLLMRCYPINNLKKLITLRNLIIEEEVVSEKLRPYLFIVLTRCLLHSSKVGINIPYVSWSSKRNPEEVFKLFKENVNMICEDLVDFTKISNTEVKTEVFLHDSRTKNQEIKARSVNMIFTSPPYLNNFDYGEALKVFLYFWKIANNWSEINKKIREVAVTSATTYYKESELLSKPYEKILSSELLKRAPSISQEIIQKAERIRKKISQRRNSRKSFDLLTLLYFQDMFQVLKELYRVLEDGSLCFIVVGDSAPYGVHIPTDTFIGEMGIELGFSSYTLQLLRERGIKWKTLTHRHNKRLRESLLILRR